MTVYSFSEDQIQTLNNLIIAGNRAGFYLQLYDYTYEQGTPSAQVALQAEISSLSGLFGDLAVYANGAAAAEAKIYGATYPGLIPFSLQIAAAENAQIARTGQLDDTNMQSVAQGVWSDNGLGAAFPGWIYSLNPWSAYGPSGLRPADAIGVFNAIVSNLGALDYGNMINTWDQSVVYSVPPNGTLNVSKDGTLQWYTDPTGNVISGTVLPTNAGFWNGGAEELQKQIQQDNAVLWTISTNDTNGQPLTISVQTDASGNFEDIAAVTNSGSQIVAATPGGYANVAVSPEESGTTTVSVTESDGSPTQSYGLTGNPNIQIASDGGLISGGNAPSAVVVGFDGSTLNGGSGNDLLLQLGDDGTANAGSGPTQIVIDGVNDTANASNATITGATGASFTVQGTNDVVNCGADDTVTGGADTSFTLSGQGTTVYLGVNDTVTGAPGASFNVFVAAGNDVIDWNDQYGRLVEEENVSNPGSSNGYTLQNWYYTGTQSYQGEWFDSQNRETQQENIYTSGPTYYTMQDWYYSGNMYLQAQWYDYSSNLTQQENVYKTGPTYYTMQDWYYSGNLQFQAQWYDRSNNLTQQENDYTTGYTMQDWYYSGNLQFQAQWYDSSNNLTQQENTYAAGSTYYTMQNWTYDGSQPWSFQALWYDWSSRPTEEEQIATNSSYTLQYWNYGATGGQYSYWEQWFTNSGQKTQEYDQQANGDHINQYWNYNGFADEYSWYNTSNQLYQQETIDYSGNPIVRVWDLSGGSWSDYANYYTPQDQLEQEVTWQNNGSYVVTSWNYLDNTALGWQSQVTDYNSAGHETAAEFVDWGGQVHDTYGTIYDAIDPADDGILTWDDPLVLNLGTGPVTTVALGNSGVTFDMLGDGLKEQTGWVAGGEGFFVVGMGGASVVSSRAMLPSLSALAAYAPSGATLITAAEADAAGIMVWVPDANGGPGTMYTLDQLGIASIALTGTPIDTTQYGNILNTGFSYTRADGSTGQGAQISFAVGPEIGGRSKTFGYQTGEGALTIGGGNAATTVQDQLVFGSGIAPSQVVVSGDAAGDIVLTIDPTDSVTLQGALLAAASSSPVQQVSFADGTVWSYAAMVSQAGTGGVGKTAIYGDVGDNLLDAKGFATYAKGGGGDDTYVFAPGYGALTVDNYSPLTAVAQGEADFAGGANSNMLWFDRSGSDLIVDILGGNDSLTIKGWYGPLTSAQVASFEAADGLVLENTDVNQLVSAMTAYAAANPTFSAGTTSMMPNDPTLQGALATAWHHTG